MNNSIFNKAVLISFLGHIAIFCVFNFSFGPTIPKINFANIYFFGATLRNINFTAGPTKVMARNPATLLLSKINQEYPLVSRDYLRPPLTLTLDTEKRISLQQNLIPRWVDSKRKEPAIMFYPKLPYHFALYFKDRQVAHIELIFELISRDKRNSLVIKRKISSGNLEADLLSMRYIGHYLFIQQPWQVTNKWQRVKIDLSAKEP